MEGGFRLVSSRGSLGSRGAGWRRLEEADIGGVVFEALATPSISILSASS